ncbi:MAG: substrate-binding domain-containing protein [Candidatus Rokubacteria bacterium]|nr:substrate-binding domain-containing protein [Candidatus Rokubacteria bacterium]
MTTTAAPEEPVRAGAVRAESRRDLGTIPIGVAVRAGAPRPDVSTVEAFRATLLAARSLGYADPARGGTAGRHFASVLARLGLTETLRATTRLYPAGVDALDAVARGELELAVTPTSEIVVRPGLVIAGLLPGDLQQRLAYSAAVIARTAAPEAARAFLERLAGPDGPARLRDAGFEPPGGP